MFYSSWHICSRRRCLRRARWLVMMAAGTLLGLGLASCGGQEEPVDSKTTAADKQWNRSSAELEYRLIQTELILAKTGRPYLVLNFQKNRLQFKIRATVVWSYPLDFTTGRSAEIREFLNSFRGEEDKLVRPLADKYLFAAKGKTPDSVLAIVGEAMKVAPGLIQRQIPERFQLRWRDGLILDVRSDVSGKPSSALKNAMVTIGRVFHKPFGEAAIVLKMEPEAAVTLYRASTPGLPTMIYPPLN